MDYHVDELCKLIINGEITHDDIISKIKDCMIKNSKSQKYILYNCEYGGFWLSDDFCKFANCDCFIYNRLLFDGFKYTDSGNKFIEFGKIKFNELDDISKNNYYVLFDNLELFERVLDSDNWNMFRIFSNLYEKSNKHSESEDDKSEDDNSENDKSENDKSENDKSENDGSENDESENDESENDGSENDEFENDELIKKEDYKKDFDKYKKLLPLIKNNILGSKYQKLLMNININKVKCDVIPEITDYMYLIVGILHSSTTLNIKKIPNYCSYEIREYDGSESIIY